LRALEPDVIISQDLCRVCAVPSGHVADALNVLGCSARVLSLDAQTLDGVIESIVEVGSVTRRSSDAHELASRLRARVDEVRAEAADLPRRRTLALEWSDPPFSGGHWVPDMIEIAGGTALLADAGAPSRRLTWDEIGDSRADTLVFMPCGYSLEQAVDEGRTLLDRQELQGARVVAVDASPLFSRPGPRLVEGLEIMAWVQHPDRFDNRHPDAVRELRPDPRQGTTGG
jgi:iron complex transport system substrate-binding protein